MRRGNLIFAICWFIGATTLPVAATTTTVTLTSDPHWLAVADVDSDGHLDIVVLTYNKLWVSTGNRDGTFNTATSTTVASNAKALALADLDGDGDLDAVVTDQPTDGVVGYVTVYPNTGTGTWGTTTSYTVDALPYDVKVADMNEDSTPDLIVVSASADTVKIILR
jgi:hypothetical protein